MECVPPDQRVLGLKEMAEEEVATNGKVEPAEEHQSETATEEKPTELEEKIIRQIEYYFGDINLSKDKFLQNLIKEDEGWVPLDTMLKFKRLARLSEDQAVIVDALAKSKSNLMEISDDKSKIRRSPDKPLPEMNEERRKELATRTVYCKGFPNDSVLDDLLDFFSKDWKLENLIMRNYQEKSTKTWHFKGSVFAVFPTIEAADAFLKVESVKYKDKELIRRWQKDYVEEKQKEWLEGKKKKEAKKKEEGGETEEKEVEKFPTGTIIHMSGLSRAISRDNIKEKIEGYGISVAYIDLNNENEEGWVRLEEQDAAKELVEKLTDSKLNVKDVDLIIRVLEGQEESSYLEKVKKEMIKRRMSGKGGRRKGRNARGGGNMRKRKASPSAEEATPAKLKAD